MPVCTTQDWHSPGCGMHRVRVWVPLFLSLEENLLGATVLQEGTYKENRLSKNLPLITSGPSK